MISDMLMWQCYPQWVRGDMILDTEKLVSKLIQLSKHELNRIVMRMKGKQRM